MKMCEDIFVGIFLLHRAVCPEASGISARRMEEV